MGRWSADSYSYESQVEPERTKQDFEAWVEGWSLYGWCIWILYYLKPLHNETPKPKSHQGFSTYESRSSCDQIQIPKPLINSRSRSYSNQAKNSMKIETLISLDPEISSRAPASLGADNTGAAHVKSSWDRHMHECTRCVLADVQASLVWPRPISRPGRLLS